MESESTWDMMMDLKPSDRPKYSPDQLYRYYDRISLPTHYRRLDAFVGMSQHGLSFLSALQKFHMAAVPFENLALHYSSSHRDGLSLEPQHLYHKIVERGMGGYCMELNTFFATVLRSLDYEVYCAGGRVNKAAMPGGADKDIEGPQYSGWSHMINIVTINDQRYMVDVGFGATGPIQPLPLIDGQVSTSVSPSSVRLSYAAIPQNTDPTQKAWRYQHRPNESSPWLDAYCFTELEFLPEDYVVMSYSTSTSRTSWFTQRIVCLKTILEKEVVIGRLSLFENELKRNIHGKMVQGETLRSEDQRVAALLDHFGINLKETEREGIMGTSPELITEYLET